MQMNSKKYQIKLISEVERSVKKNKVKKVLMEAKSIAE